MKQLAQDIDQSVEITAFTLRKLFLGFVRAFMSGPMLIHKDPLRNFKYTGDTTGIRVDIVDLEDKKKIDLSSGVYLADGSITYTEHTIGGKGEGDLRSGSSSFQVEGTHNFQVIIIADSPDEVNMLGDNIFFFLLSLKSMLTNCAMESLTEIKVNGQSKTSRLDDRRFIRAVDFAVKASHQVVNLPETHLLHTIDMKLFQEHFIQ